MKPLLALLAAAVTAVSTMPVAAQVGPFTLYDDFGSTSIDPARWLEAERDRRVALVGTNRWLALTQTDWGLTDSDAGRPAYNWGQELSLGEPVTQLRTTVRVDTLEVTGCAFNPSPTRVRARLIGTLFNSGNRVRNSMVGDVLAQIFVVRASNSVDPPGVMRVQYNLLVCTTSDCNPSGSNAGSTTLASGDLGTAALNTNVTLQMAWDKATKKVVFTRDPGTGSESSQQAAYTLSDHSDPGFPLVGIQTRNEPANCASGPRTVARVAARFDNVQVNTRARP